MVVARILVLIATFITGLVGAWLASTSRVELPRQEPFVLIPPTEQSGSGHSGKHLKHAAEPIPGQPPYASSLKITQKPKAHYTDSARTNGIEGTVKLRVVFLASGGIGAVTVINGLPDGLTEQAIAAARQIRFEPEIRDGRAWTTVRTVTYSFDIY